MRPYCCWIDRRRRFSRRWRGAGIFGGLDLGERYPELGHAMLVCATETKLDADIKAYAAALADVMSASRAAA